MKCQRDLGLLVLAALAWFCVGCGTSQYMDRVTKGLEGVQASAMFMNVSGPLEFPGAPLTYRLPTYVDAQAKAYTEESAEPSGQGKVNPERVQPPFVKLPGLKMCYEMLGTDAGGQSQSPYYLYVAAIPAGETAADGKSIEDSLQAQITAGLNVQPQWENVNCPVQNGPTVPARRLIATGPQGFLDQLGATKNMPGVFELYSREVGGYRVLLAWRYSEKLTERPGQFANLVCGSVTAPTAEPAPAGN